MKKTVIYGLLLANILGIRPDSVWGQSNSFVSQTCIGGTGAEGRLYNAVAADFDGDGNLDVLVNDESANILIYKNQGNGTFSGSINIATGTFGLMRTGDFDGDGAVDFAHSNGFIYLNNGLGTAFSKRGKNPPTNTTPFFSNAGTIGVGDFNADGRVDIFWGKAANGPTDYNEVQLNTSSGGTLSFATPTTNQFWDNTNLDPRYTNAIGDIDGDGDLDIVTGGGSYSNVRKNNGNGTFAASQTMSNYSARVWLADWDSDGDLDYIIADSYNGFGFRVRRNNGSGTFETTISGNLLSSGVVVHAIGDLNGDGLIDAVWGVHGTTSKYYTNTGCLLNQQSQDMSNGNNGAVVADFTNDGKPDILFLARDAASCLYRNDLNTATTPPLANITATTAGERCGTGTIVLGATASNAGTLKWYASASGGGLLHTGATYSPSVNGSTVYYVDATNATGCISARTAVAATVNTNYSLPTSTQTLSQNVSSNTNFTDNQCRMLAVVTPSGGSPVSGTVEVKTWIESSAFSYVNRHYEITPQSNGGSATGTIKLYFSQADFDAYNSNNALDLPTGPTDEVGKSYLKIIKYSGSSSDGSGLPGTYNGSPTSLTPSSVIWNSTNNQWEVTFDVTGFSGFFVQAENIVLPIEWLDFKAKNTPLGNVLTWQTATADHGTYFDIERSIDGAAFNTIGTIKAQGMGYIYQFTDKEAVNSSYYRLRANTPDAPNSYSKVVHVLKHPNTSLVVYPSVAHHTLSIETPIDTPFEIVNTIGQLVLKGILTPTIDISSLPKGRYWLKTADAMATFVKQ